MTDPAEPGDQVDEQVDGDRDPLTTDDGLAEVAAAGMPEVEDRDVEPGEDAQPLADRTLLDNPDLDVAADGTDPLAAAGQPGAGD